MLRTVVYEGEAAKSNLATGSSQDLFWVSIAAFDCDFGNPISGGEQTQDFMEHNR